MFIGLVGGRTLILHTREERTQRSVNNSASGYQRKEIACTCRRPSVALASLTNGTIHLAQKLNKMLKILDALYCSRKHRETSSIRQSDTCIWLPATDAYKSWREGNDTFLWLQGKGTFSIIWMSFLSTLVPSQLVLEKPF